MKHLLVLTLFCIGTAVSSAAEVEIVDGVPVVHNGAEPTNGLREIPLTELWRVGGDDEEIFFGNIAGTTCDEAGNLFILDGQQSQVQVYDPEGQWLRTLSREGDGPGEVRGPDGMFLDHSGRVCLFQAPLGKIIGVNQDGTPAEPLKYGAGDGQDAVVTILLGGEVAGAGLALSGIRLDFEGATSRRHYFISFCNAQAQQTQVVMEKDDFVDYSDFRLAETSMDFAWSRWAVDPQGRVYVAPARNEYRIELHGPDDAIERIITRQYRSYLRDDDLRRRATLVIEGVAAYHGVPLQGVTIEDTEPDIRGMWVDQEGFLYVQTSRGQREKPDGAYAVFDVFDPKGEFVRQVAPLCDADPEKDSLNFLPDGRFVVILGDLDAWLTQQAVDREEEEQEEAEAGALEVVVFAPK